MTVFRMTVNLHTALKRVALTASIVFNPLTGHSADVKVAFTGDQGTNENAVEVLRLIADEGTDLLLLQGDFGYLENTAMLWDQQLSDHLGPDFPVVSVVGNHENFEWPLYKQLITQRIERIDELDCEGDIGVKATCAFRGLQITQVAAGIKEVEGVAERDGYPEYITDTLGNSTANWRICSWHKNQAKMQTGNKADDAGWPVYQACLGVGGIAATAHEHAYSRTHLLSDFANQTIVHSDDVLEIKPGQTFAFVSGLGGNSIRPQTRDDDWWASIYTADQAASYGALFCTFAESTAECYFKSIDGAVPDRFTLKNEVVPPVTPPVVTPPIPAPVGEPDPAVDPEIDPGSDSASPLTSSSSGGNPAAVLGILLTVALWRRRSLLAKFQ